MNWFSHDYHGWRYCSWACTHDCGDGDDGFAQDGGHLPNNKLTETCSLGLPCTSLILGIYVMINWHLSKQGICWQYRIAGSSLQLIKVTCFLKLTTDQVLVFHWSRARVRLTCCKQGRIVQKPVNPNPGLKFNRIITFSSIQFFWPLCFVYVAIIKLKAESQTINRKPHRKVTKFKSKFYLFLG